jgi:predicted nucleotidyltransferase
MPGQLTMSAYRRILLQKSKVASVRIFGETLKREAIDDSDNLSRVTEVAYEFSVRR